MALTLSDPLVWGIIALVVLVIEFLIIANMKAQGKASAATYAATTKAPQLGDDEDLTAILSRFVEDAKGETVGETVGVDGDMLILKQGASYKAVPRKHVVDESGTLKVKGVVSWDEAEKLGTEWKERQHREITYTSEELPEDERDQA